MRQLDICILGGSGFVGSHIAVRLAASGHRVKVLCRRRERHRNLLVVPEIQLIEANIFDRIQLLRHFTSCDAVINLVGILNEKGHRGDGFYKLHVELAKLVLDACLSKEVPRLIHMSALNANASNGPSFYLRSKGEAEDAMLNANSDKIAITSFRPSVIFGPHDSFFNRFASLLRIAPLVFPLACPDARFAPVYVGDVTNRFISALSDPSCTGQAYELCGPHDYSLIELVRYTARLLGMSKPVIGLPDAISKLEAHIFEWLPGKPFSVDNYHSLKIDSICQQGQHEPTSIESIVPGYIKAGNYHHKYDDYRKTAGR
jgi:NADH dehydrogenase